MSENIANILPLVAAETDQCHQYEVETCDDLGSVTQTNIQGKDSRHACTVQTLNTSSQQPIKSVTYTSLLLLLLLQLLFRTISRHTFLKDYIVSSFFLLVTEMVTVSLHKISNIKGYFNLEKYTV